MFSYFFSAASKDERSIAKEQDIAINEFSLKLASTKVLEQLRLGGEPGGPGGHAYL
jgi:hypothetical protein